MRFSADNCDHQRKAKRAGASKRLRGAANAKPYRQRILHRPGINTLSGQRRPMFAGPVHVLVLADLQQQVELLGKERVVVLQLQAEQRKRLDKRPAAHHHLRPALRKQIECSEVLKYPHRVGRAQDGYSTGQAYALRPCRRRSQNDRRRRVEVLLAVMFADSKHVEPDLVGVFDLLNQIAQALRPADREAGVVICCRETIDSNFHLRDSGFPRAPRFPPPFDSASWPASMLAPCIPGFFCDPTNCSFSFSDSAENKSSRSFACCSKHDAASRFPCGVSATTRARRSLGLDLRTTSPSLSSRSTAAVIEPLARRTFSWMSPMLS